MGQPYIGEIRIFGGYFAPVGWAFCDGSVISISDNDTLFNLIGTTYGGDGQSTFALPDLRSRIPVHQGTSGGITRVPGQNGGVEEVLLTVNQIPSHSHPPMATTASGTTTDPTGAVWAAWQDSPYSAAEPTVPLRADALTRSGGNGAHANMPPYLTVNFIISLFGVYPSQS